MPCVSIIVPVYNVPEKYLKNCIESLINQSLTDIEIILVDDGSTDNSGIVCDEYALNDSRIQVIHKKNGGLSAARNSGVRLAKSKYITMVDGDDWLEKEALDEAYKQAIKNNAEIVCWGTVKDYGTYSVPFKYDSNFKDGKLYCGTECKYMQEMLLHYNGQIATAYSKLISKDLIDKYNIYHKEELRQGSEGLEFCFRLFGKASSILFINKHWYHYIYNANSISAKSSEKNNEYILKCFEKIYNLIDETDNRENLRKWFYNRLLYVIITTAISGCFHPENKDTYKQKKRKYNEYLKKPLVAETLKNAKTFDLSKSRKITLFLIKHKFFFAINLIAKLRYKQKQ